MPELPEVETVVRAVRPHVTGRTIERLELHHPRVYRHSNPAHLCGGVEGRSVESLDRRGKFILFRLSDGGPPLALHLRMSGRLLLHPSAAQSPHLRATLHLTDTSPLYFVDTRTFGTLFLIDGSEPEGFRKLGVEPLSRAFTAAHLRDLARDRTASVKSFLLDQTKIAGIGNIYAIEALWIARIDPTLPAGELDESAIRRLHRAIRAVLRAAILDMGTTFSDFQRPMGEEGGYGNKLHVYGRTGHPCPRCSTSLERMIQHGRSTIFCPRCQHSSRRLAR